ncbi:hypothetical protein HMPREF0549_1559, partial [Limosilactobacillus vaginalis DSM 5837 = ATCC 49540]
LILYNLKKSSEKILATLFSSIIEDGGVDMTKNKIIAWFFVILWAIVLYLTLTNKMMLAMDLMAIGMFLDAIKCLIKS